MAKKSAEETIFETQTDLFGYQNKIIGLGIVDVKIGKGEIAAMLRGVTESQDLAQITDDTWLAAIAAWMVALTGNSAERMAMFIDEARADYYRREQDLLAAQAALNAASTVANFPRGAVSALA